MSNIQSGNDIIDVRDIIARVEYLRGELDNLLEAILDAKHSIPVMKFENDASEHTKACIAERQWRQDNSEEFRSLEELLQELSGNGGDEQWEGNWYPVTLIHESYFEQSMDELVADCYEIPKDLPSFMTITLDYDALKQDYTTCEFEGETHYYR